MSIMVFGTVLMMSYLRSALAILNLMASYSRGEVKQFFTIRIKNAYPFYLLGYEKKLTAIFDYFKQLPGLVLAGRTGAYKYMDIDQCMEDTAELIKRFKKKGAI